MKAKAIFLPARDCAVLQNEYPPRNGQHPQQAGPHSKSSPQQPVADIQGVAEHGVGAIRHERAESSAPGARDDPDVADCPKAEGLPSDDEAGSDKEWPGGSCFALMHDDEHESYRHRKPRTLTECPGTKAARQSRSSDAFWCPRHRTIIDPGAPTPR